MRETIINPYKNVMITERLTQLFQESRREVEIPLHSVPREFCTHCRFRQLVKPSIIVITQTWKRRILISMTHYSDATDK